MCGIIVIVRRCPTESALRDLRKDAIKYRKLIQHRGPDYSGLEIIQTKCKDIYIAMIHERLVIVDPESGEQPISSDDSQQVLAVNGEIYNHQSLRDDIYKDYAFRTKSDCEVIIPWYRSYRDYRQKGEKAEIAECGSETEAAYYKLLDGMYAFAVWDNEYQQMIVARDQIGIIPLYMGERFIYFPDKMHGNFTEITFSSELKVLEAMQCDKINIFRPGTSSLVTLTEERAEFDSKPFDSYIPDISSTFPTTTVSLETIRDTLERAVKKQLMSDVPYGVLLSGGLDSSLIASIASKYAKKRVESGPLQEDAHFPRLHTFSIGLDMKDSGGRESPDLYFARKVAKHIHSVHHQFTFRMQEALDALSSVIYMTESYDVTTIRASTPMYLLSRRIKSMGIKMVLSGEGADELYGGYLYFHKAPSEKEFYDETVDKVSKLHLFDCLRANKSTAAWGLELRPPFLDNEFVSMALHMHPKQKMVTEEQPMEKFVLRMAFAHQPDSDKPGYQPYEYLPDSVLFRQKEQFSDGVGYDWITVLKEFTNASVTDEQLLSAETIYPFNTPKTKEAYYYRTLFHSHFPSDEAAKTVLFEDSIACSTARALEWDASFKSCADQSGRAVSGVHVDSW